MKHAVRLHAGVPFEIFGPYRRAPRWRARLLAAVLAALIAAPLLLALATRGA